MKKAILIILALCILAGSFSVAAADGLYQAQAPEAFGALLSGLVVAYEEPAEDSWTRIMELLEEIKSSSAEDSVASACHRFRNPDTLSQTVSVFPDCLPVM